MRAIGIALPTLILAAFSSMTTWAAPVLLISIDGLRPDAVTQADRHALQIPNLRRFVTEGAFAEGVIGVYPTLTLPSHTTIVTGVDPSVHGIVSNSIFDPLHVSEEGNLW